MSEKLAREFHEIYEYLAPDFGYETRNDTKEFDPESPNGALMIAVCIQIANKIEAKNMRFFMAGFSQGYGSEPGGIDDVNISYEKTAALLGRM